MFYVDCYARADSKAPCMIQAYKTLTSAQKRAEKARKTFPRVDIVQSKESAFKRGTAL